MCHFKEILPYINTLKVIDNAVYVKERLEDSKVYANMHTVFTML